MKNRAELEIGFVQSVLCRFGVFGRLPRKACLFVDVSVCRKEVVWIVSCCGFFFVLFFYKLVCPAGSLWKWGFRVSLKQLLSCPDTSALALCLEGTVLCLSFWYS